MKMRIRTGQASRLGQRIRKICYVLSCVYSLAQAGGRWGEEKNFGVRWCQDNEGPKRKWRVKKGSVFHNCATLATSHSSIIHVYMALITQSMLVFS